MTTISADSDTERSERNLERNSEEIATVAGGRAMGYQILKTWPEHFEELWQGRKTFELRKADRPFAVGDRLRLDEFIPGGTWRGDYTGRRLKAQVSHLLRGPVFGLKEGWVLLSLKDITNVSAALE